MSIFFGYVGELNCQEISLKIKAESTLEQQISDSINNGSTFKKMDDLLKGRTEKKEEPAKEEKKKGKTKKGRMRIFGSDDDI